MTDTFTFDPATLTGDLVLEVRSRHKLSRAQFSERAGFTGRSTARLSNIENKDSWKPGDRESVARVLSELEGGRFDPRYHATQSMAVTSPVVDDRATVVVTGDDLDDGDAIVDVVTPRPVIDLPTPVAMEYDPTQITGDVYRVSNGELQSWKRCRRRWWLGWYRGLALQTEDFTGVRAVGTRVHKALERWYVPEGEVRIDPRDALERVIVDDWTAIAKLATERRYGEDQFNDLAKAFAASTNLERVMVEGYVQWLQETGVDAELRVIASETPLTVNIELDVDGTWERIQLIGLLDVRVHRVTDGRNLIIDHKTVGDLSSPTVTLPLNEQVLQYILLEYLNAIETEVRSRLDPESLDRTTYVFRVQPTTPMAVSLLRETDHGGRGSAQVDSSSLGSQSLEQRPDQPRTVMLGMPQFASQQRPTSTQIRGTSPSTQRGGEATRPSYAQVVGGVEGQDVQIDEGIMATAASRVVTGALYNMLRRVQRTARAKPPFYGRVEVHHNGHELDSYLTRALAATRDILRARRALDAGADHHAVAYPSPRPQCSWDCDFLPVCNMLDDGSPGVDDMLTMLYREYDPRARYDKTEGRVE